MPDLRFLGASIYDVRTQGQGGGVVEKQTKVLISWVSGTVAGEGVKKLKILWRSLMEAP